MGTVIAFLAEWYPVIVGVVVPALIAIAWVVVRRTPSTKDDAVLQRIEDVVSVLPGGKAKPVGGASSPLSAPEAPRPTMAERTQDPKHPSGVVRPRG